MKKNLNLKHLKNVLQTICDKSLDTSQVAKHVCLELHSLGFKILDSGTFSITFYKPYFRHIVKVSPSSFKELGEYPPFPSNERAQQFFLKPSFMHNGVIIQPRARTNETFKDQSYDIISSHISKNKLHLLDIHRDNCSFYRNKPIFFDYGIITASSRQFTFPNEFRDLIKELFNYDIPLD